MANQIRIGSQEDHPQLVAPGILLEIACGAGAQMVFENLLYGSGTLRLSLRCQTEGVAACSFTSTTERSHSRIRCNV
jgi:hypothetical protein